MQALSGSFWSIYPESFLSLIFCILSLFLENVPQVLWVNPGCKCISGMNLSPASKNLFHSFYTFKTKQEQVKKLTQLICCCLTNSDFLPLHTANFDKSIGFPLFVFATLGFYSLYFFCFSNNNIVLSIY